MSCCSSTPAPRRRASPSPRAPPRKSPGRGSGPAAQAGRWPCPWTWPRPGRLLQPRHVRAPRTEVDFTILVGHGRTGSQFSSYWVLSLVCQVGLLWPGVLTSNGVASAAGENTGFWSQGCCVGASTEGVGASESQQSPASGARTLSPSSLMHFPALWLTSCVLLAKLFDLSVPVSSFVKSE